MSESDERVCRGIGVCHYYAGMVSVFKTGSFMISSEGVFHLDFP